MKKMVPLMVLLFSCVSAMAGGRPQSAGEDEAAVEAGDPQRRVCKQTKVVGTRLPTRVCHSQREWDEIDLATRNRMREIDSQRIPVRGEGGGRTGPGG